jgi:hypothetical protein
MTGISHQTKLLYRRIIGIMEAVLYFLHIGIYRRIVSKKIMRNVIFDPLTTRIWVIPALRKRFFVYSDKKFIFQNTIPRSIHHTSFGNH